MWLCASNSIALHKIRHTSLFWISPTLLQHFLWCLSFVTQWLQIQTRYSATLAKHTSVLGFSPFSVSYQYFMNISAFIFHDMWPQDLEPLLSFMTTVEKQETLCLIGLRCFAVAFILKNTHWTSESKPMLRGKKKLSEIISEFWEKFSKSCLNDELLMPWCV